MAGIEHEALRPMKVERFNPREQIVLAAFLVVIVAAAIAYRAHRLQPRVAERWHRAERITQIGALELRIMGDLHNNVIRSPNPRALLGPIPPAMSSYYSHLLATDGLEDGVPEAFLFACDDRVRVGMSLWGGKNLLEQYDYELTGRELRLVRYDPTNGARSEGMWASGPMPNFKLK